jgi:phosphopantothenoylcysteine decarboxylase/phosphopantothenate--cysteine ligase
VIAANVTVPAPSGVRLVPVGSAAELADACETHFDSTHVLLMAAAVADFRPAHVAQTKLKKDRGTPLVELEPTPDVLSSLAARRSPGQLLVGFAAEHGDGALEYAADKLARKGLDAIVVNDISRPGIGFDADQNEVSILTAQGRPRHVEQTSKRRIAAAVLDEVERLLAINREDTDGAARADAGSTARV